MIKYNHSNPVAIEAAKYCDMGFYPICKINDNGQEFYSVLTPFRGDQGKIVRTRRQEIYPTSENVDFNNTGVSDGNLLISIEGFYNPSYKLFKVGDLVQYKDIYHKDSFFKKQKQGFKIQEVNDVYGFYTVRLLEDIETRPLRDEPKIPLYCFEPFLNLNDDYIQEITIQEIADKFNVDINHLRIK